MTPQEVLVKSPVKFSVGIRMRPSGVSPWINAVPSTKTTPSTESAEDASLIEGWADGDRFCFEALYRRHYAPLVRYAGVLGCGPDSPDVVHDAILHGHERLSQLRDPGSLGPWLRSIVRTQAETRRRRTERYAYLDCEYLEHVPSCGPEPGSAVIEQRDSRDLYAAARSLSTDDQKLLVLHLDLGISGTLLARELGVSPRHAYVLKNRMQRRLAAAMKTLRFLKSHSSRCEKMRALAATREQFTPAVRRRVVRHRRLCVRCSSDMPGQTTDNDGQTNLLIDARLLSARSS